MRVDLIAPVRLATRPALHALVDRDLPEVCRRIAAETGTRPGTGAPDLTAVGIIVDNEPTDGALLPRYLCRGPVALDGVPAGLASSVRAAELLVTPYGLAIFCFVVDLGPDEELATYEEGLCALVASSAAAFDARLRTALQELDLLVEESRGVRGLPLNTFLWWHRVLEVFTPPELEVATSLDRFPDVSVRPGTTLRVGDGYSRIETDSEDERRMLLEGLYSATQVWLVTDRLQRELAEQASRLRAATTRSDDALKAEQDQALRVCEETMLESQLLLEEQRYLSGGRRQAMEAAAEAWRMPLDLRGLFEAADMVRDVVDRRVQQRREAQADRLNRLLAALTLVTALSIVLLIFETAVGVKPEFFPARILAAVAVAVTTVTSVAVVWRRS